MKNQILAQSEYNPPVGCGWNVGKVIDEGETILFSKIGWRTNLVFRMPKEECLKAIEILKREVYNTHFAYSYHQWIGGTFSDRVAPLAQRQKEYIDNIWNNFQSFIYETKRYNRKYFSELDDLMKTVKTVY